jgi:hypothetical protein
MKSYAISAGQLAVKNPEKGLPSWVDIHFGRRIRHESQRAGLADTARGLADEIMLEVLPARQLWDGSRNRPGHRQRIEIHVNRHVRVSAVLIKPEVFPPRFQVKPQGRTRIRNPIEPAPDQLGFVVDRAPIFSTHVLADLRGQVHEAEKLSETLMGAAETTTEITLQIAPNPATQDIIAFSECTKSIPNRD